MAVDWERTGELTVAVEDHQVEWLRESGGRFLDRDQVQAEVHSPTYLAGVLRRRRRAAPPRPDGRRARPGRQRPRRRDRRGHPGHRARERPQRTGAGPHRLRHRHRRPGRAGDQRLPGAAAARAAAYGAGLRLRRHDRAAVGRAARGDRVAGPAGARRPRQPVPLLPAQRRRPDPVRRVRRGLPLRQAGPVGVRAPARVVPPAGLPPAHDVPAARGRTGHPPVGGGDRHQHPVLRVLGAGHRGRVAHTRGLHRARRRCQPVRRRRAARPAVRRGDRADPPRDGASPAAAVPAGAGRGARHPRHPLVARPFRPPAGPAQPVAARRSTRWASASTRSPCWRGALPDPRLPRRGAARLRARHQRRGGRLHPRARAGRPACSGCASRRSTARSTRPATPYRLHDPVDLQALRVRPRAGRPRPGRGARRGRRRAVGRGVRRAVAWRRAPGDRATR